MRSFVKSTRTLAVAAAIGSLVAVSFASGAQAANPCAPNPCAGKKADNPCAGKKAANPCASKNPCAPKH